MKMNRTSYESCMSRIVITVDVYLFRNLKMSETWTIPCVEHIPDAEELEQMFQDLENNKLPTLQWKNPGRKLPEGNWLCEPHAWAAGLLKMYFYPRAIDACPTCYPCPIPAKHQRLV